ncbi:hypothetical protein MPTK1_7g01340 [Marchantia polymorpha subsp. ruderalis]|uniref:Uncharacterized protein n=2 Tax=Marchantia polymorpha TaxID=3197 RepID=A0AAF6BV06_MARPO|nr:hypothetical protein MARPO_0099s0008 [Marchantia polymorpha]BBN15840.1 hypothetical protein Mp_7g01340 [Marchantia polymorpha subsp. ruderalis]|eukprot:PTQ32368.1 hypothetical protein MARPO_0099s0008 [Marchantia polymorpha]
MLSTRPAALLGRGRAGRCAEESREVWPRSMPILCTVGGWQNSKLSTEVYDSMLPDLAPEPKGHRTLEREFVCLRDCRVWNTPHARHYLPILPRLLAFVLDSCMFCPRVRSMSLLWNLEPPTTVLSFPD